MKKTRVIVVCAMLIAMHTVLNFVGTITVTNFIKFSVASLPVIVGGLILGPGYGFAVGFLGHLIYQIISYPFSVFSLLYALAYGIIGLVAGLLGMMWKYDYARQGRTMLRVGIVSVTSTMLLTLLNTAVIYLQSTAEGWYTKQGVFGTLGMKLLKNVFLCIVYIIVLPPVLKTAVSVLKGEREN